VSATIATKPRLAMYWAASCGGCDIAVLNLHEKIVDVAAAVEIVFWPAVMDAKYKDVEAMPDGFIDVCLFSGGIRSSENEELAHLLRRKSKVLIAFGSCANEGCIPGLANLSTVPQIFAASYEDGNSTVNPDGVLPVASWTAPEGELHIPVSPGPVRCHRTGASSAPASPRSATSAPGRGTSRRSPSSSGSRTWRRWTRHSACWSRGSPATGRRRGTAAGRSARRPAPSASAATGPPRASSTTGRG